MVACTGAKRYFKAAERMEKQGLVSDAAEYYLQSLQRNPSFVDARIKLKEVGQKHLSGLASDFFRNYNTQQLEECLQSFEKLKDFHSKASALNVSLDYPKQYNDDYQKAVQNYCEKNYQSAYERVYQKNYREALPYLQNVIRYNSGYKKVAELEITAVCEPLYQSAIANLGNKDYASALSALTQIKAKSETYKDVQDLYTLASEQQVRSFMLFQPTNLSRNNLSEVKDYLFTNFNQLALQKLTQFRVINNSPFQSGNGLGDFNSSNNVDLIQAIRKATGADYYYIFDVTNRVEYDPGPSRTKARGFIEVKTKKNDTLEIVEYKPFDYNVVKAQRSFSYEYKYKIINAATNQMVSTMAQNLRSADEVNYQEFISSAAGNINALFPYNPQVTPAAAQYNPRGWRNLFSARSNLKSMEDLKNEVLNHNMNVFITSTKGMR